MNPTLNSSEAAYANLTPVAGQTPVSQTDVNATKASFGLSDVPNALFGAMTGGLGSVAGGVASALAAPMPSLTATVTANPNVRFGDNYIPQMTRDSTAGTDSYAGKVGSFAVSSGNSNAEARGQVGTGVPGWVWIAAGVAVAVAVVVWLVNRK